MSPVSWKHIIFYGKYNFLETATDIDLSAIVDWLEAFYGGGKGANWHFAVLVKKTQDENAIMFSLALIERRCRVIYEQ